MRRAAESYDRCIVLIRAAKENDYLCVEVPVSGAQAMPRGAAAAVACVCWHTCRHAANRFAARSRADALRCAAPCRLQDASYAQYSADKLQGVENCRKHSTYRDSDGMLW
jgi:hypothetical protein